MKKYINLEFCILFIDYLRINDEWKNKKRLNVNVATETKESTVSKTLTVPSYPMNGIRLSWISSYEYYNANTRYYRSKHYKIYIIKCT